MQDLSSEKKSLVDFCSSGLMSSCLSSGIWSPWLPEESSRSPWDGWLTTIHGVVITGATHNRREKQDDWSRSCKNLYYIRPRPLVGSPSCKQQNREEHDVSCLYDDPECIGIIMHSQQCIIITNNAFYGLHKRQYNFSVESNQNVESKRKSMEFITI